MNPLFKFAKGVVSSVRLHDKPLPEPEPVNAKPRPMTGFFASLTPEQQRAALAYRGPENHGPAKAQS